MELTPELFESIEFTKVKRGGYDEDEVEVFLEQAGTEVARLLARMQHADRRIATLEAELAQARSAPAPVPAAAPAPAPAPSAAAIDEQQEVEQAARTLVMARRTADATLNEARQEADTLVAEARAASERTLGEARSQAEALVGRAREAAEREFAERKRRLQDEITLLETRRDDLGEDVDAVESRLEEIRRHVAEVMGTLEAVAAGARPQPTEAAATVQPAAEPVAAARVVEVTPAPTPAPAPAPAPAAAPVSTVQEPLPTPTTPNGIADEPTMAHTAVAPGDAWGPGSWSKVSAAVVTEESEEGDAVIDLGAESRAEAAAGSRDRYLEALDAAVNGEDDPDGDDEQIAAFFEGDPSQARTRRFGRRR